MSSVLAQFLSVSSAEGVNSFLVRRHSLSQSGVGGVAPNVSLWRGFCNRNVDCKTKACSPFVRWFDFYFHLTLFAVVVE